MHGFWIIVLILLVIFISGCVQDQPKTKVCHNNITVNENEECPLYWCGDKTCLLGTYKGYSEDCSTCPQDCGECPTNDLNEYSTTSTTTNEEYCPVSCDNCTIDSCSSQTNYECIHNRIQNCCGDNICDSQDECNYCISDCYSFSSGVYYAKIQECSDSTLITIRPSSLLTMFSPQSYKDKIVTISNLQDTTNQKIVNFIGKSPKTPLIFRFISDSSIVDNFGSENTIEYPISEIDKFYNLYSKGESIMEVHEVVHAINSNNCYDEHYLSKIPNWVNEGTALVFSFIIPLETGNSIDWQSATDSRQMSKNVFVDGFDEVTWKPNLNNPHDKGDVFFYIWAKYNISSTQFTQFMNSLYTLCQNRIDILTDREVISTWNQVTGRYDDQIFNAWGIL
jgi:hypothetical protein